MTTHRDSQDWKQPKRRETPVDLSGGGGQCTCPNTWYISGQGAIVGGYALLPFTVNEVTENIQIDFDMTSAEVKAALLTHSESPASVDIAINSGGHLPDVDVHLTFRGELIETELSGIDNTAIDGDPGARLQIGSFAAIDE